VNFKVSLNLPKLVRFKVGIKLGLDDGAKLDLRIKLRGGRVWRWSAMAEPAKTKSLEKNGHDEPPLLGQADQDRVGQ
jgi:hypothetical protein